VDALTADGAIVAIRPAAADDAAALAELFARSSAASLRLRFFATPGRPTLTAEVDRLTRPPTPEHATIVAELAGTPVGVASYERDGPTAPRAEFAVFVDDAHQGRGIGTLLLEHLALRARRSGITGLYGEVLAANARMLHVAGDLAATARSRIVDGLVEVSVATTADDAVIAGMDARDRAAERASLRPLLAPRSVAVVGAGRRSEGLGHEVLRGLVGYGFTGPVYPVNRHAKPPGQPGGTQTTVAGVPAYPSLADLPGPVDLVVVAVPPDQVPGVLADAGACGARAAVVMTGFAATAPELAAPAPAELLRLARAGGIRLVGPDSLGVINTDPEVRLDASFAPNPPPPGGLAVASQSGAVGVAVLEHAARHGCGISGFVSLGGKLDVSGNDLIAYWYGDPATRAVALYLESFGNPRRFGRVARALARRKPVLAVFSGRAAMPGAAVDALFAQAGVVRAEDLGALVDAARMLTDQPLPAGNRLAVIGNAGGANVLAADAAAAEGLYLPAAVAGRDNPLDLGTAATGSALAEALAAAAGSGAVDAVLAVVTATRASDPDAMRDAVAAVADAHPDLPMAAVVLGPGDAAALGDRRVPCYDLPERAVRALGHATRYAAWRREPLGSRPALDDVDAAAARAAVRAAVDAGGGWLTDAGAAAVLAAYRIPLSPAPAGTGAVDPAGVVEMVAGIAHDPLFGSLVMTGLRGLATDLLGDRAYRLVPMTDLDAGRMWRSLRAAALLTGDTGALEDLLLRLGRLAEDLPEVAELVLDPVGVGVAGVTVAAARVRVAATGDEPDPALRRLR
jgi:acyl-CoA synthetase (NDP forming)/GNAT superfamily N-acetyltransferase